MSSSLVARRGALTALTVFAVATLFLLGLAQGSASAAEVNGSAVVTLNTGKTGKATAIAPAKGKRVGKKGVKATAPVKSLEFIGSTVKAGLGGGVKLTNGKRSVKITGLSLAVGKNLTVVRGKLGKKSLVLFTAKGKATINTADQTVKLNGAKLTLPKSVGKQVKKQLKLKKAPTGKVGSLNLNASIKPDVDPCVADPNAEGCNPDPCVLDPNAPGCQPDPCIANPDAGGCPVTDPYLAQCNVAATSKVTGALPGPAALPTLTDPKAITGPTTLAWGIKQSFRGYVVNTAGPGAANGSLHGLDGATLVGTAPYGGTNDTVNWTFVDGTLSDNGTPNNAGDDKAIVNLNGTVVFCATGHNFRVAISDPTIVIDGTDSRIVADVDSNLAGVWTPTQRVDIADLSLVGGGSALSLLTNSLGTKFENLYATMTDTGSKAICGDSDPRCSYTSGTAMDDLTFDAPTGPLVDQYNAECGVAAASRQFNSWEPASALPEITNPLTTTEPTAINWGFKSSFRGYVFGAPPAGTLQALDGASRAPGGDPTRGFSFPVSGGAYKANNAADNTDDQAVVPGSGTALFCKAGHFFWASISNPTVVIDGENSRIVATISQNTNGGGNPAGPWQTPQRVDLADLDLSNVTPIYNKSGSEVTWTNIPVTLASGAAPFATYQAGEALDPITVSVKTPYDTSDFAALATYVETNHPFPKSDPAQGGCEVGVPATGRTIDEAGSPYAWYASPGAAAATPNVTGTAVTGGGFDWGFRTSLRGSINGAGQFNLAGGATASHTYVGNGPGSIPGPGGGAMSGAGKFFTWPTASGTYDAGAAGDADDKLVMRTQGTVAFCAVNAAQRYGTILSNPTVIIDGANSRITLDVTTRFRLSWLRATVDFATLDLSGIVIGSNTAGGVTTKSWTFPDAGADPDGSGPLLAEGPVELTADGEKMVRVLSATGYLAGLGLDGATIRASFPE